MFTELLEKLNNEIIRNRSVTCEKTLRYNELIEHFRSIGFDTPSEFDAEYELLESDLSTLQSHYERLSHTLGLIQECERSVDVVDIAYILSNDHFEHVY